MSVHISKSSSTSSSADNADEDRPYPAAESSRDELSSEEESDDKQTQAPHTSRKEDINNPDSSLPASDPLRLQRTKDLGLQRNSRPRPRPGNNSSNSSTAAAGRKKKKGLAFPLLVLAGALALSYVLPKLLAKFGIDLNGGANDAAMPRIQHYPLCRTGTVIITDAAYGHARQTALLLADQGMHVIACVRNKQEELSFASDARKGLEPLLVDVSEPNDVAKLFYRLKFVTADLQRPLYGVLVNTADLVLSSDGDQNQEKEKEKEKDKDVAQQASGSSGPTRQSPSFNSSHLRQISREVIDVPALDDAYNRWVRGPLRVVQGALDVFSAAQIKYEASQTTEQGHAGVCDGDDALNASGECEALTEAEGQPHNEALTANTSVASSSRRVRDAELCATGATARIFFMTYDVNEENRATQAGKRAPSVGGKGGSGSSSHGLSWLSKLFPAPKSKLQKKPEYRRRENDTASTGNNKFGDARSGGGKTSAVAAAAPYCGATCALNAALKSYADQLESALWDSNVLVSRMAVASKPYRPKGSGKAAYKGESALTLNEEAQAIRQMQLDWVELVSIEKSFAEQDAAGADGKSKSNNGKKKGGKSPAAMPRSSLVINPKYSLEANQAAHAFLSSRPLQWYDQHRPAPKRVRAKFLGL